MHAAQDQQLAPSPDRRRERGSMTPLYVLFGMVILGMLTVVVDTTQVFIYQRSLHSIADGASLAAADGIDVDEIYVDGLDQDGRVELARNAARQAVEDYMAAVEKPGVTCALTGFSPTRVTVGCTGRVRLPLANFLVDNARGVQVRSEASAEAFTQG